MTLAYLVEEFSAIPTAEIEIVLDPPRIGSGILFVHATWSGQSIAAFGKLTSFLAGLPERPQLYVCDIDALAEDVRRDLGSLEGWGLLHGYGETFWIVDGEVRAAFNAYGRDDFSTDLAAVHAKFFGTS